MPLTPWVLRLIIANVAVFVLDQASPGIRITFELIPAWLPERPWSIVSYMFLHAGFGHIFFNMLSLYIFGPRLEAMLGSRRFLTVYFVSGIVGGLLSFVTPHVAIIGASGAVMGVMAGYAYHWPHDPIYIWGVLPVRAWLFIVIMAVLSVWGGFGGPGEGIAHFAHLGGIAGGYLTILWFARASGRQRLSVSWKRPVGGRRVQRWNRIRRESLHEVNRAEFDRIMEKLRSGGADSLTESEQTFLDNFSDRA